MEALSKTFLEKAIVAETKNLSVDALREILSFIELIKARKVNGPAKKSFENDVKKELDALDKMSLAHLEKEFMDYKQLHPRE